MTRKGGGRDTRPTSEGGPGPVVLAAAEPAACECETNNGFNRTLNYPRDWWRNHSKALHERIRALEAERDELKARVVEMENCSVCGRDASEHPCEPQERGRGD